MAARKTNKPSVETLMQHVIAAIDIEKIINENRPMLEKTISTHVRDLIENMDWSEYLYEALSERQLNAALQEKFRRALTETFFPTNTSRR